MKKPAKWRLWSSIALFLLAALMIYPTVRWYSLSERERDRAEASVQPETDNPHLSAVLDSLQERGGADLVEDYRELHQLKQGTIKLGLDLQGGMYLAYTVKPSEGLDTRDALDQALEVIRNRIDEFGVSEPSITRQGDDRIIVQLPGVRDPARARSIVERQALLEFKLVAYPNSETQSPVGVPVIREINEELTGEEEPMEEDTLFPSLPDTSPLDEPDTSETGTITFPDRPEAEVGDEGEGLGPIPIPGEEPEMQPGPTLEVPAAPDREGFPGLFIQVPEDVARTLSISPGDWAIRTGDDLDRFNDVINLPSVDSILAERNLEFSLGRKMQTSEGELVPVFLVPRDMTRGWDRQTSVERSHYYLTGASLEDVRVRMGGAGAISNNPYLILQFDSRGAENWTRITGDNVGERVAILLDGTIYSVATIRERISGSGTRLSGGFTVEEARDLRLVLKAGSLPAELELAEEQTIGPSLGRKSINQGVVAGIIGLVLISIFIIVYYGLGGVLAVMALAFDLIIVLGVLCFPGPLAGLGVHGLNATLTLPGIAGIILTIGMAVDASVLIYERIREERRAGKGIRTAVDAGYSRAFVTILDANLTTLITALVLYRFGTGPIRGFAVTLSIGILASMFCSLVFTRAMIALILKSRKIKDLNLGKLAFLSSPDFKITSVRKKTYLLSLLVIIVGIVAFAANKGLDLSIDFTGGLETNVLSQEMVAPEILREDLERRGLESVQVQSLVDYAGEGSAFVVRTAEDDKDVVYEALDEVGCRPMEEGEEGLSFIKQIGPRVGSELRAKAINAIVIAMIFIILYIWYRFQFKWGVAAVAALAHDILITVGIIALIRMEVSLTIIAALLTIVGYSINDTIVVFDRIREDRKLRKGRTFEETVNISINETLSRTVITSLTTFMAVLMLFIFGGEILADFSLTLLMGIVIGTYSSIFVASPILVDWTRKVAKGKAKIRKGLRKKKSRK